MPDQTPAQTPAPVPNQPAAPLPAAPPEVHKPPEKRPISTASTRLDPTQPGGVPAEKPAPPKGPDGKFISPNAPPAEPTKSAIVADLPSKPARPAWLEQVAAGLGFTKEEIERSDADSLGNAVMLAQRHTARSQQPNVPATPPPPPAEVKVDLGLTPEQEEEFGPEMMSVLKKIATDNAKKTQDLEARLGQYEQREVNRTREQLVDAIDTAIGGLGKEYATILGEGDGAHTIAHNPAAHRRRVFVLTNLEAKGLNFRTASPAAIAEAIKAQIEEDFPGSIKAAPPPPTNPPVVTKDQWNRGGSPAPTQRRGSADLEGGKGLGDKNGDPVTDEDVADEKIKAMLRKRKRGLVV